MNLSSVIERHCKLIIQKYSLREVCHSTIKVDLQIFQMSSVIPRAGYQDFW